MWNQFATPNAAAAPGAITSPGAAAPGGWHPTVLYLIALVAVEFVILGIVSRKLLK